MRPRNKLKKGEYRLEMNLELERNGPVVEYTVIFDYYPGDPGKGYGPPENCYPPESPEITDCEVWYDEVKKCRNCQGTGLVGNVRCTTCLGHGKLITRERRAELDALVSEDELIKYAQENPPED